MEIGKGGADSITLQPLCTPIIKAPRRVQLKIDSPYLTGHGFLVTKYVAVGCLLQELMSLLILQ